MHMLESACEVGRSEVQVHASVTQACDCIVSPGLQEAALSLDMLAAFTVALVGSRRKNPLAFKEALVLLLSGGRRWFCPISCIRSGYFDPLDSGDLSGTRSYRHPIHSRRAHGITAGDQ